MSTGLVLGRFIPLHNGHVFLIDFAKKNIDTLYICLCSTHDDPIEGEVRKQWLSELFPKVHIVHIEKEIPEAHAGNKNAPKIWADFLRTILPEQIDTVFASEDYGWEFASALNAVFFPLDIARSTLSVSASYIRAEPFRYWDFMPPPVRAWFVKCVGVHASETQTQKLAQYFHTIAMTSFKLRYDAYVEKNKEQIQKHNAPLLQDSQIALAVETELQTLKRVANKILFVCLEKDTPQLQKFLDYEIEAKDIHELDIERSATAVAQKYQHLGISHAIEQQRGQYQYA